MYYTSSSTHVPVGFYLFGIVIALGLAFVPAVIASNKGRSFGLWFLFGFLCWLPALIVSIVITDESTGSRSQWSPAPPPWSTPPPPPPPGAPPAGWYPDPGGSGSQRYWDGARWTEHLH